MSLSIGDAIGIVDEHGQHHKGLVTTIHGHASQASRDAQFREFYADQPERLEEVLTMPFVEPTINAVYVSKDASKRDPYGHQIERFSSLQPRTATTAHGRFWYFL